ncbi:hypothetical protein ACOSQ3_019169 [Xanthoceras sorbifolium]
MVTLSKPLFVTQFSLGIYATDDPKKTEHLLALDGAKQRLHIFKASLLEEGSLDSAVDGCDGVFHTASPVLLSSKVPQADIVDPALKGTLDHLMKLGFLIRLFVRNQRYTEEKASAPIYQVRETLSMPENGASGYIASWLVKLLLQRGYTVKATVRDPNDPKKTQHLLALDGAKQRLHIFKASLSEEGAFDSAIDGCDGVFQTASPVVFSTNDPQADIVDAAIKGALNVLKSCAKVSSVKRVVFTSSMASVMYNGKPLTPQTVIDETWFSDPALCDNLKIYEMN